MKYCCTNCNYVFDEWLWDIDVWIEPWTSVLNLWDYFCCPVCSEWIDSFEIIKEEVNYLDEVTNFNLNSLELEHYIEYKIEEDILYVWVWKEPHSMNQNHYISSIMIYDEYGDLIEEKFLNHNLEAEVEFDISYIDDFEIRARCNIAWVWGRKIERE